MRYDLKTALTLGVAYSPQAEALCSTSNAKLTFTISIFKALQDLAMQRRSVRFKWREFNIEMFNVFSAPLDCSDIVAQ